METPFVLPARDRGRGPRVVHFLPSSPPLVPVLSADGEVTPDTDRVLTVIAREAQAGDVAARNALYAACEPKIARFARRYRVTTAGPDRCPAFDLDDVTQEAFLVFADLIESWPGGESFCAYFLGHFPWELRNAVRRLAAANRPSAGLVAAPGVYFLADGSAAAAEAVALLQTVAETLPAPDGNILLWRVRDGEGFGTIARRLGTSTRTATRAWDRIVSEFRRSLTV